GGAAPECRPDRRALPREWRPRRGRRRRDVRPIGFRLHRIASGEGSTAGLAPAGFVFGAPPLPPWGEGGGPLRCATTGRERRRMRGCWTERHVGPPLIRLALLGPFSHKGRRWAATFSAPPLSLAAQGADNECQETAERSVSPLIRDSGQARHRASTRRCPLPD